MAEFLTTRGTSHYLERIIEGSTRQIVLLSPFLQISKTLLERLRDAANREVVIFIIYGKDDLKPSEQKSLEELKTVTLFYHENLHAKCYLNEKKMIITSMNMYQYSENNNREMGVLIDATDDEQLYQNAVKEVQSIVKNSKVVYSHNNSKENGKGNKSMNTNPAKKSEKGFCIRCNASIYYDPYKPLCEDCYSIWASFGNPFYQENFCHNCGHTDKSSMQYPLCNACWEKRPFM